jgi:hypothetical protein
MSTRELMIGVTRWNSAPFLRARLASVRETIGLDPPFALGFTSKYWRPCFERLGSRRGEASDPR